MSTQSIANPNGTRGRYSGGAPKPGVYRGMSNEDYHALDAVQASLLKRVSESPLAARAWQTGEIEDALGWSGYFGTAVHAALLEPARYRVQAVEVPKLSPKAISKTFAAAQEANPGKIILAEGWVGMIEKIRRRVAENAEAVEIIGAKGGLAELVVVWKDEESGLLMKARLDWVIPGRETMVVDLKTSSDISPDAFGRVCWDYGYDIQIAHAEAAVRAAAQLDPSLGLSPETTASIIAIQNETPFDVAVYDLPEDAFVGIGHTRRRECIASWCACLVDKRYHGAAGPTGRRELPLPGWALQRYADGGAR